MTADILTGADTLTDDEQELWYGKISVGTPAVTYTGRSFQMSQTRAQLTRILI